VLILKIKINLKKIFLCIFKRKSLLKNTLHHNIKCTLKKVCFHISLSSSIDARKKKNDPYIISFTTLFETLRELLTKKKTTIKLLSGRKYVDIPFPILILTKISNFWINWKNWNTIMNDMTSLFIIPCNNTKTYFLKRNRCIYINLNFIFLYYFFLLIVNSHNMKGSYIRFCLLNVNYRVIGSIKK
jgi:hypothetical protein